MKTFEQFQATREWCDDLRTVQPDAYEDISRGIPCGMVYDGDCVIERTGTSPDVFLLMIYNEQYTGTDLALLERTLYDWAADEFGDEA